MISDNKQQFGSTTGIGYLQGKLLKIKQIINFIYNPHEQRKAAKKLVYYFAEDCGCKYSTIINYRVFRSKLNKVNDV